LKLDFQFKHPDRVEKLGSEDKRQVEVLKRLYEEHCNENNLEDEVAKK